MMNIKGETTAMLEKLDGRKVKSLIELLSGFHRVRGSKDYHDSMMAAIDYLKRSGMPSRRFKVFSYPADGKTVNGNVATTLAWEPIYGEMWLERPERFFITSTSISKVALVSGSAGSEGWKELSLVQFEGKKDYSNKAVLASDDPVKVFQQAVVEGGASCLIFNYMRKSFEEIGRSLEKLPEMTNYLSIPYDREAADKKAVAFSITKEKYDLLAGAVARGGAVVGFRSEVKLTEGELEVLQVDATGVENGPGVIITAHLCHPSPGADDNASGAALAVELARILHQAEFPFPVKIALVPEYLGSVPYALQLKREKKLPLFTVNLDMVGADQDKTGSTFILSKVPPYLPQKWGRILEYFITELMPRNGGYPLKRFGEIPFMAGSDHCVFTTLGIPSPFLGHLPDRYYHSDFDTPSMMDRVELEWVGRSVLKTLEHIITPDPLAAAAAKGKMIGELHEILSRIAGREGAGDLLDLLVSNYEGDVLRGNFAEACGLSSSRPLEPTFESSLGLEWMKIVPQELKNEVGPELLSMADFMAGGSLVIGSREAVELLTSIHYGVPIEKVRTLTGWMIERSLLRSS